MYCVQTPAWIESLVLRVPFNLQEKSTRQVLLAVTETEAEAQKRFKAVPKHSWGRGGQSKVANSGPADCRAPVVPLPSPPGSPSRKMEK